MLVDEAVLSTATVGTTGMSTGKISVTLCGSTSIVFSHD